MARQPITKYSLDMFTWVESIAKGQGANQNLAEICAVVSAYESNNYLSPVARANNNYSGIMYRGKDSHGYTRGTPFPKKEGKYFYAKYANEKFWVMDFIRIMKRIFITNGKFFYPYKSFPGSVAPLYVWQEVARIMKQKGYFTDSADNYARNLYAVYKQYHEAVQPVIKAKKAVKEQQEEKQEQTIIQQGKDLAKQIDPTADAWYKKLTWKEYAVAAAFIYLIAKK